MGVRHKFFRWYLARNGHKIKKYTNRNIDLDKKYNGVTALYIACAKQNEGMVKRLLSANVSLNIKNAGGKTALHVACAKNNFEIVKMLLNKNVDINVQDNIGNTPLHLACINGNEAIAKLLLNKNANVNIANNAKVCPIHLACHAGNYNIVELLLGKGAKVNACAKYGITPLHYACYIGHYDITKLLLKACADLNIKDATGRLAINMACANNYPNIVNELIKANSKVPLNIMDWAIQKQEVEILKSLAKRRDVAKYLIKKLIVSNKIMLLRQIRNARINLNSMEKVEGVSLLELAIRNNNVDMANILMAHNFGGINNTIAKLNELVNNVCVNELLKEPKTEQATTIRNMKRERECENILDIIHQSKKCKILAN